MVQFAHEAQYSQSESAMPPLVKPILEAGVRIGTKQIQHNFISLDYYGYFFGAVLRS